MDDLMARDDKVKVKVKVNQNGLCVQKACLKDYMQMEFVETWCK